MSNSPSLRIARSIPRSAVNGPGERFVLWVQGCPLACLGCWNPDTWSRSGGQEVAVDDLAAEILATHEIEGVTLTGGEPFAQAAALLALVRRLRSHGLSVMVFTGFALAELRTPDQLELLSESDVVVAERYDQAQRASDLPWRGSVNQTIHFMSGRYGTKDIPESQAVEFHIGDDGRLTVTGFPIESGLLR